MLAYVSETNSFYFCRCKQCPLNGEASDDYALTEEDMDYGEDMDIDDEVDNESL